MIGFVTFSLWHFNTRYCIIIAVVKQKIVIKERFLCQAKY